MPGASLSSEKYQNEYQLVVFLVDERVGQIFFGLLLEGPGSWEQPAPEFLLEGARFRSTDNP